MGTFNFENLKKALLDSKGRLNGIVDQTPLIYSESLSKEVHCQVYLKLENLQKTGSYKLRGAYNAIASLPKDTREKGVVTASAGNHAQGVGYAAKASGIARESFIFMPWDTPQVKINNTAEYGVQVRTTDDAGTDLEDYDAAKKFAKKFAEEKGKAYIPAFDGTEVIAGQGTVGLEILEQLPDVNAIMVPIGGGGLISGIGTAIKVLKQKEDIHIIGVEAEGAAHGLACLREKRWLDGLTEVETIADGIKVKRIGEQNFAIMLELVDCVVAVKEMLIYRAVTTMFAKSKIVAEGAGAIGLAPLLRCAELMHIKKISSIEFSENVFANSVYIRGDKDNKVGKKKIELNPKSKVVLVVSGGNVDVNLFNKMSEYEMHLLENYLRVVVRLDDEPEALFNLLLDIKDTELKPNIADIIPFGTRWGTPVGRIELQLLIETKGKAHRERLISAIKTLEYDYDIII